MILSSSLCGNTKLPAKSSDRHLPVTPCFRITWWDQQPVCFLARGPSVLDSEPHGEQAHTRFLFFVGSEAEPLRLSASTDTQGTAVRLWYQNRDSGSGRVMCGCAWGHFPPLCVFKLHSRRNGSVRMSLYSKHACCYCESTLPFRHRSLSVNASFR